MLHCVTAKPRGMRCSGERSSTVSSKTTFIKGSKPRRTPVTFLLAFSCNNNLLSMYLQHSAYVCHVLAVWILSQVWNVHASAHSCRAPTSPPRSSLKIHISFHFVSICTLHYIRTDTTIISSDGRGCRLGGALPSLLVMEALRCHYIIFSVGHHGKFGHEFLEFEFRPDGKLRYANDSNYKRDLLIRKEIYLNGLVLEELRRIVRESEVMAEDDRLWPMPDKVGRQELEIIMGTEHIKFTVCARKRVSIHVVCVDKQTGILVGCTRQPRPWRTKGLLLPRPRPQIFCILSGFGPFQSQAHLNTLYLGIHTMRRVDFHGNHPLNGLSAPRQPSRYHALLTITLVSGPSLILI